MSRSHYSVYPRYSAGSPAAVPRATAERVVEQEKEGYEHALSGVYGLQHKEAAE